MLCGLLRLSAFLVVLHGMFLTVVRAEDEATCPLRPTLSALSKPLSSLNDLRSRLLPPFVRTAGTLPSPVSGGAVNGVGIAINDRGQVAGSIWTEGGPMRGVVWDRGTWTELGDLGSGGDVAPRGINQHGEVVGWNYHGGELHGFLWRNGTMIDLGVVEDLGYAYMRLAINNHGQIIVTRSSQQNPNVLKAFVWDQGQFTDLGSLGGDFTSAYDINDQGQVTGFSNTEVNGTALGLHIFLWERGVMTDLGPLTYSGYPRVMVNNRGQVAYSDRVDDDEELVLWTRGVMDVRPGLGGMHSSVNAINGRGQVIGTSMTPVGTTWHAVLWDQRGVVRDLDPGSTTQSEAVGINEAGQVAVQADEEGELRGYSWHHGQLTDLGDLGGGATWVQAINRRGQIIGASNTSTGSQTFRPFLWENGVMIDLLASTTHGKRPFPGPFADASHRSDTKAAEARGAGAGLSITNPSRGSAQLVIRVPFGDSWDLALFDVQGRRVQEFGAGTGSGNLLTLRWDGTSLSGARTIPGVYLARLTFGSQTITKRLLWLGN